MQVDIYCDPACPWCWVTSRWLLEVAEKRDLTIGWRPFSLWRKNQDIQSPEYLAAVFPTHQLLRVFEAVREAEGNDAVGRLYTVVGTWRHHDGVRDIDITKALDVASLDRRLASAADDEAWDDVITATMSAALALSGDDVGTPILTFDGKAAFFGPIVTPVPTGEEAARLFDAVHTLATMDGFWELKRTREGDPEMTARPDVPELTQLLAAT